MPRIFVHISFFLFIITSMTGVWMRSFSFFSSPISYTNILHAHSHVAILGWAFLGLLIIYLKVFWRDIHHKKQSISLVMTLFIVSTIMFITFIYQGYGTYSIMMSTLHIFIEYWAIIFIYKQLKRSSYFPDIIKMFMNASLLFLFISSFGPFSLGFISAKGLQSSSLFDMAIYFYLHFQYNGWLTLFSIGLLLMILFKKGIKYHSTLLKIGFWIYFSALLPWYFLSILWVELNIPSHLFATIGSIGQWIGVLLIFIALYNIPKRLKRTESALTLACLRLTLILLFIKSTMELGLISPTLANLVYDTRHVIIGYLHLTLLGFISLFILTQLQMLKIIFPTKKVTIYGFAFFIGGFILNEFYLFTMGLSTWIHMRILPYPSEMLLLASLLLTIGIGTIWYSYLKTRKLL